MSLDLKPLRVCDSVIDDGKVFQILGTYDEKARSPNERIYSFVGQPVSLDEKNAMRAQVYTLPGDYEDTVVPYRSEL